MSRNPHWRIVAFLIAAWLFSCPARAQTPDTATAALRQITVDGLTRLTQDQFIALTGLQLDSQVSRRDMQASADRVVATGLFLDFHVKESPRLPVFFDNIPWFGDSELAAAIRTRLPFYDGTLPEAGNVVDSAAGAVKELLASHKLDVALQHQVFANPLGDGNVQLFSIEGAAL